MVPFLVGLTVGAHHGRAAAIKSRPALLPEEPAQRPPVTTR